MGKIAVPSNLSPEAEKFYRRSRAEFGPGPDLGFLLLLENACHTLQRLRDAEALLQREGVVYNDRFGKPRAHPAATRVDCEGLALEKQIKSLRAVIATARYSRMMKESRR